MSKDIRRALMVAKDVLPFDSPERQANLEKHMEGSKTPPVLYHATHADVPEFKKMKGSHLGFHFGDRDSALERLEDTTAPHVDLGEAKRVSAEFDKRSAPFRAYEEELRRKDREIPSEEFTKALEASGDDLSGPALRDLFDKYRYQPTDEENAKLQALKEQKDLYNVPVYGTGANVGAYHVSIKNPLRMYDVGNWGDVGAVKKHLPFPTNARSLDQIRREIQDRGYDGVVYKNRVENRIMGTDSFIAFDPEQIKSATGNAGTFDPESRRVNEARGGLVTKARGGSVHPATQIPGVHISERTHGKPIFTEEREGRADGGTVFPDQTQADEGITAYQGGPHSVGPEGYDNAKIGTGEGAAAYGHGHYFAEAEPVAQGYRDRLSPASIKAKSGELLGGSTEAADYIGGKDRYKDPKGLRDLYDETLGYIQKGDTLDTAITRMHRNFKDFTPPEELAKAEGLLREHTPEKVSAGHMHQVLIKGKPEHFFDWDALLDEQSPHVMKALQNTEWFDGYREAAEDRAANRGHNPTGADLMRELWQDWEKPEVSEMMAQAGIRGVRHLDQFSRKAGKGTRNYVVFDPKHIDIQRRYARGGTVHPARQIPGIHVNERTHGKPIFTGERIGKEGGGLLTNQDQDGEEGITAYQGGPHSVGPEGYDNAKIGTGEGVQAYGYGHYFAENEDVARDYREGLSGHLPKTLIDRQTGEPIPETTPGYGPVKAWAQSHWLPMDKWDENARDYEKKRLFDRRDPLHRSIGEIKRSLPYASDEDRPWFEEQLEKHRNERSELADAMSLIDKVGEAPRGHMHQVRIQGRPEHFLDWDKPLSEQSAHVQGAVKSLSHFTQRERETLPIRIVYEMLGAPKEASERLSGAGVRGIRFFDQGSRGAGTGTRNYVVFDPKHIDIQRRYARGGMAYADGGSLPDAGVQKALDLTRDLNPQGLYSHASEAAMASPQAKGPLPQMLASLKGVKPDEMKYSGVEQAFAGQPQVTREQLAQHFTKNIPQLNETVLRPGANDGATQYQAYTLPGGQNYREVLIHRPELSEKERINTAMAFQRRMNGIYGPGWSDPNVPLSPEHQAEYDQMERKMSRRDEYSHPHWSVPDVVGHYRASDRTGPDGEKILHVEEVQSDWAQQARAAKKARGVAAYDPAKPYQVYDLTTDKVVSQHATPEEAQSEVEKHRGEKYLSASHARTLRVPPAGPYVSSTDNATDLILKHILTAAARGNYDKVVFTPGDEQAKRWGEPGLKQYYDETIPKRLNDLVAQHDPEAKLEEHQILGLRKPTEEKSADHYRLEELAGGDLSDAQAEAIRDYLHNDREEHGFIRPDAFEDALNHAMLAGPDFSYGASLPGINVTPRLREGINKRGFKAYARGGDVEGTMRIAKAGGGPLGDDEAVKKALALTAQTQPSAPQQAVQAAKQQAPSAFFEIAPGKTYHPALQERWEALHPDDKAAISKRMVEDFLPRWQKMSGVRGHVKAGHGGFGGFTNPNYTFHPDDPANMQRSLHDLGDLFSQDAMMGAHAQPFEGSFPAGVVRVHMPKGVSPDEIHGVYKELNERGLAEGHSTDPEAGTMDILAGSGGEDTEQHAKAVADHLNGRYDVSSYPAHVAFPEHGADYGLSGTQTSGSPGTPVSEAHNNLRAEATRRLEDLVGQAHAQRGTGQGQVGGREGFADGGSKDAPPPRMPLTFSDADINKALAITRVGNPQQAALMAAKHIGDLTTRSNLSSRVHRPIEDMSATYVPTEQLSPETPIPWEATQGSRMMAAPGDRTMGGHALTHVGGKELSFYPSLEGGYDFSRSQAGQKENAGWASGLTVTSGMGKQIRREAEKGQPLILSHVAMSGESGDFSHMMADTLLAQMPASKITKKAKKEFDRDMRSVEEPSVAKSWPGIDAPNLRQHLHAHGPSRYWFSKVMDQSKHQDAGFPSAAEARYAITANDLINVPSGQTGQMFVRLDPEGAVFSNLRNPHSTYPTQIQTQGYMGRPTESLPRDVAFRDWHNKRREMGKDPRGDERSFNMSRDVSQVMDQEQIDHIMGFLERRKRGEV